LERNKDKIEWELFSKNPSIFTYDYEYLRDRMYETSLCEEMMMYIYHSKNIIKWGAEDI